MITSNRAVEELAQLFNDPLLASAAMDRLLQHAHVIVRRVTASVAHHPSGAATARMFKLRRRPDERSEITPERISLAVPATDPRRARRCRSSRRPNEDLFGRPAPDLLGRPLTAERPGVLWHSDVCHGPVLHIGGELMPLRIHALLDGASRYIVAIQAHHQQRELDMIGLLVRAFRRHGGPDTYLDNGSTYRGEVLRLCCERLSISLVHAQPGDAPARGEMERFWRTLREGCLDHLGQLASLDDVNARLEVFVAHYHRAPHSSLMGRAPGVLLLESDDHRRADRITEEMLRDALTMREKRRVRRDTIVSVDGRDWELDQGFLAGRIVTIGRCLADLSQRPWVQHEGKRWLLHPIDPVGNARRRRPPRRPEDATNTAAAAAPSGFDPAGALLAAPRSRIKSEVPS